jgi:hypothetical protein
MKKIDVGMPTLIETNNIENCSGYKEFAMEGIELLLESRLKNQEYDLIVEFGQKPNAKSIYLEIKACFNSDEFTTNYAYNN